MCQCCNGYETLTKKLSGESKNYLAGRLRKRLLSDALGKGIVRGQVENTNLRVHGKDHDVTAAECFRTCATHAFFGREYVKTVERHNDNIARRENALFPEVDGRAHKKKKKLYFRNVSVLYGERPQNSEVWQLSPYEFVTYWEPQLVSYPQSLEDVENPCHHVKMTHSGMQKLQFLSLIHI